MSSEATSSQPQSRQGAGSLLVNIMAAWGFTVGVLNLIGAGQMWLLWLALVTLTVIGFLCLGRLLTIPSFTTPWSVYATSLSLGYGFGALNTMARGYTSGLALLEVTFADIAALGRAEGAVLMLVSALLVIGSLDSNKILPQQRFTRAELNATFMLLLLVAGGAAVAVATGKLGYQGGQGAEDGSAQISPVASLISASLTTVLGCTAFAFGNESRTKRRLFVMALCLVLAATLMIQGRRIFMFGMLVGLIGFFAARGARQFFTLKSLVILFAVGVVIMTTSKFYMAMRVASYTAGPNPTLMERVEGGWDVIRNAEAEGLDERVAENQGTRTFIVGYLAELTHAVETHAVVGGDILILNLASAVPTMVWPGKWRIISRGGSEENICHPQFGLPMWDAANTTLTAGLCDFGWFGLFSYPILVVALFSLYNRAFRLAPALVRALVAFATVEAFFQVETAMLGYFVSVRNITALALLTWALVWLFQKLGRLTEPTVGATDIRRM